MGALGGRMAEKIVAIIHAYENATGEKPRLYMSEKTLRDLDRELGYSECIFKHIYNQEDLSVVMTFEGCHVGINNMLGYEDILIKEA